jgi:Kef-type K+ transport system membrane component KefB
MQDPEYADVPLSSLMVFTGVGMSITAFPVLARILTETTLITTPIGKPAMSISRRRHGLVLSQSL